MTGQDLDAFSFFFGDFIVSYLGFLARFIDFFMDLLTGFLAAGGPKRMPAMYPAAAPITKVTANPRAKFLSFDMAFLLPFFHLPQDETGHRED